jgi:helix-turn-helix protein
VPAELPAGVAGRAHRAVDSLHAMLYFAPEADEELTAVGLRPGRMGYFASRSAAMGAVSAGVTTATFYNFNPTLVARHIPRAWGLASLDDILAARLRAADRALRRLLGDHVALSPAIQEAGELTRAATVQLSPHGRPLYAAHAELPWPAEPHLALWHAVTLLREYRGDGHVAVLLGSGLTGLDALITHTATGRGFTVAAAKATRGWSDEEWATGQAGLRARGFLDGEGGLTAAGIELRDSVERATDMLGEAPWITIGPEATDRLIELGRGLSRQLLASGAFSADVFARSGA